MDKEVNTILLNDLALLAFIEMLVVKVASMKVKHLVISEVSTILLSSPPSEVN